MLEQAACDELLGRLHHVLPHFKRSTLLIEECESLIWAYGAALFFSQAHEMRKCDFSDHAFSVFLVCLVGHCLAPTGFAFQVILMPVLRTHFPLMLEASAIRRTGTASTGSNSPSKSPSGESCFAVSCASIPDARRLHPCLRYVPMRLSKHR